MNLYFLGEGYCLMKKLELRETQETLLDILVYTDSILKKHNLRYSLAYGSLIGAARHKGFIPWDDDLDIVMPVQDYLKMLELKELNDPENRFSIYYPGNVSRRYNYPFAKIEDNQTKCKFYKCNDNGGAFLDIFPVTPLPYSDSQIYLKKLSVLHNRLAFTYSRTDNFFKNFIHILSSPLYRYYRDNLEKLSLKYSDLQNYDYLIDSMWGTKKEERLLPKKWFDNYTQLEFEKHKFDVISNYDDWLNMVYGDWKSLPPEQQRVAHHDYELYVNDKEF